MPSAITAAARAVRVLRLKILMGILLFEVLLELVAGEQDANTADTNDRSASRVPDRKKPRLDGEVELVHCNGCRTGSVSKRQ
jgi:hypothetical protein